MRGLEWGLGVGVPFHGGSGGWACGVRPKLVLLPALLPCLVQQPLDRHPLLMPCWLGGAARAWLAGLQPMRPPQMPIQDAGCMPALPAAAPSTSPTTGSVGPQLLCGGAGGPASPTTSSVTPQLLCGRTGGPARG